MKKVFFAIGVLSILASCANTTTEETTGVDSTTTVVPVDSTVGVDSVSVDVTVVDSTSVQ